MRHRALALALASLVAVATGCTSGGGGPAAGPNPSGTVDPGPNPTGTSNPGPNTTAKGPDTIGGVLRVVGPCAQIVVGATGASTTRYELVLPRGWLVTASGLVIDGQLMARAGDQMFLTGRRRAQNGRCGRDFAAEHLVSVIPG